MLKSEAMQDGSLKIASAISNLGLAMSDLGLIHKNGFSDGVVREVVRQISKIEAVIMELKDLGEVFDGQIEEGTIGGERRLKCLKD